MKETYAKRWLHAVLLTTSVSLAGAATALAAHTGGAVQLLDASGQNLDAATPYSPRATCARACHVASGDAVDYAGHDYGSGLKEVTKTQGVIESDGNVYWQSYNVHAFAHGAVVGRHSQEGRNEDYSIAMKTAFGDAFFTSSPGMFGKY